MGRLACALRDLPRPCRPYPRPKPDESPGGRLRAVVFAEPSHGGGPGFMFGCMTRSVSRVFMVSATVRRQLGFVSRDYLLLRLAVWLSLLGLRSILRKGLSTG